jgi:hypothetical protein
MQPGKVFSDVELICDDFVSGVESAGARPKSKAPGGAGLGIVVFGETGLSTSKCLSSFMLSP